MLFLLHPSSLVADSWFGYDSDTIPSVSDVSCPCISLEIDQLTSLLRAFFEAFSRYWEAVIQKFFHQQSPSILNRISFLDTR